MVSIAHRVSVPGHRESRARRRQHHGNNPARSYVPQDRTNLALRSEILVRSVQEVQAHDGPTKASRGSPKAGAAPKKIQDVSFRRPQQSRAKAYSR